MEDRGEGKFWGEERNEGEGREREWRGRKGKERQGKERQGKERTTRLYGLTSYIITFIL